MGALSSGLFAFRNTEKVFHGDGSRKAMPFVQGYNSIYDLAKMELGKISKGANTLLDKVDDAGKVFGVSNTATKVATVASKAVNPLLCVASGIRVFKDDDQYSALVEEGLAMGSMFGAEIGFKHLRKAAAGAIEKGSLDGIIKNKTVQKFGNNLISSIKNMSKGQKTALAIAAEVLFVATSVCAFDIGKKIGKKATGRESVPKSNNPFKVKTERAS